MKIKIIIFLFLTINSICLLAQITLTKEGISVYNTEKGFWLGDNISRSSPTIFTYRNNSIISVNAQGYMLQAGDEVPGINNNNLDGEVITGNTFYWNGTDSTSICHGIFTGYNINAIIKYNYLNNVPMGISRKSNGMANTYGGIAYNIINKTKAVAIAVKGMKEVNIYNNTFYSDQTMYKGPGVGTWRGLIDVLSNTDNTNITPNAPSSGTKIKNNIFYTVHQIFNIYIYDAACLSNFESDYNVFYCESGTPIFNYLGTLKTFAQWQALGYDLHSIVVNPNFINTIDFVPTVRLDYGTILGTDWQTGLSTTAKWVVGKSPSTTNQNGTWQVGARIYQIKRVSGITLTGSDGATTITENNGALQLQLEVLPVDAVNKSVTWSVLNLTGKASINSSGLLIAEKDGIVKAIAMATDGSGIKGELQITISNQVVPVESITVSSTGGTTITSDNGKLQLLAMVLPADATNRSVTWSVINETGNASISTSGILTAENDGKVKVIATSNDGSGITGELIIDISNQHILIQNISIIDTLKKEIIYGTGTNLQLNAYLTPSNATNQKVKWFVENLTGKATISEEGVLTTLSYGTIKVIAKAMDGSNIISEKMYQIDIPVFNHSYKKYNGFQVQYYSEDKKVQVQLNFDPTEDVILEVRNLLGQKLFEQKIYNSTTNFFPNFPGHIFLIVLRFKNQVRTKMVFL